MHRSMLETAVTIMKRKRSPQHFSKIYEEVVAELGFNEDEAKANIARFYNDVSLSALFVYTGDNNWDLKERQPADMWDKDASFFIDPEELKARKAQRLAERLAEREARKELEEIAELEDNRDETEYDEEDLGYQEDLDDFVDEEDEDLPDFSSELDEDDLDDIDDEETDESDDDEELETSTDDDDMDEEEYNDIMDDFEDLYDDEK